MTSSGASETEMPRKRVAPAPRRTMASATVAPPAAGEVDVEEDHVGAERRDPGHRLVHVTGLADDLELILQLGAQPAAEELMVVDQEEPGPRAGGSHDAALGSSRWTSVPCPGLLVTVAVPPWRRILPTTDWAMPRRSAGTAPTSKPAPSSRT